MSNFKRSPTDSSQKKIKIKRRLVDGIKLSFDAKSLTKTISQPLFLDSDLD